MIRRPKIAALANLFGFAIVIGLIVAIATSMWAIHELKVGGPIYQRIILGKDLVADILPPPEYIIEAYLEVNLVRENPVTLPQARSRLAKLHREYDQRHKYWTGQDMDSGLRDQLTRDAHTPAARFWDQVERRFLPALANGDMETAEAVYGAIVEAYTAHRAEIDKVVASAGRMTEETERYAHDQEEIYLAVVRTVSAIVLLIAVTGAISLVVGVVRPVRDMTAAMAKLAGGDLSIGIPSTGSGD